MKAATFDDGRLRLEDRPTPTPGDNEVLVRVAAASICGSDLGILAKHFFATPGVVMGHEYCGTVESVGSAVTRVSSGNKVVIEPNIPCGHCEYCRRLLPAMCDDLKTLGQTHDGGFAEYSLVPEKQVHLLPDDADMDQMALVEPLTCALGALDRMNARPADVAVVLGAGPLGLLFAQVIQASGARVVVSEPSEFRRSHAQAINPAAVVDPADLGGTVRRLSSIGADLVVDCVGSLQRQAIPLLRRGGRLVLFGINDSAESSIRQYDITLNNLQIFGSFIGFGDFPRAISMVYEGYVSATPLITHKLSLDEITTGVELLKKQKAVKVIVNP